MRKIVVNVIMVVLLVILSVSFLVGCSESEQGLTKRIQDLEERLGKIEDKTADYEKLKERVANIESTVEALDELKSLSSKVGALTEKITELSDMTDMLQKNLIANTVADNEMKTQVTAMQSKLDKFYYDGTESIDLSKTQAMLDKVYGQVVQDEYKMGDVIKVQSNGIHYYTIQVVGEYHDGRVIKQDTGDKMPCSTPEGPKHWCGHLVFTNYIYHEVNKTTLAWELIFASQGGGNQIYLQTYGTKPETVGGSYLPIKYGETKKVLWQLTYDFVEGVPFNMNFGLARGLAGEEGVGFRFVAARIKNFYDGKQQPIVAVP